MDNYSIVLFLLGVMIIFSAIAEKIRIPVPVVLIVVGIAVGFIPSLPEIALNPEVVFLLFLPPLLYDAAFNIRFDEFKTNMNTIGTLAISLVFLTATGIAVMAHYIIPGMTWPLAFVLGAILSATDAVAATSVTKGLGLSHKTLTILEGESLVNDASALVAYRFAVAAVTGTAFVFWKASLEFLVVLAGGFGVGVVMGWILAFLLTRFKQNYMVSISLMLLMPFIAYLLAEEFHVSGVIAVVVLGLMIARFSKKIFPEHVKQQSKSIWDIIIFLLNGLMFIFIGLEFPYVLKGIDAAHVWVYVLYALLAVIVAIVIRMLRVFLQKVNLQRAFQKNDKRVTEAALLDFKTSLIITWAGMRGIVSLAVALGLPRTLNDGTPFPERDIIIFISVVAVLITLLGQGLTLPWLVRTLHKKGAHKSG
ncbi:Na+/H+ antiporter [Chitinophaga sp. Hz27]|uniref:Na+/H+ antiporter n=1 Tax=Chitinophaga sp. Hz27 TaxID=3347169 RepID=UPI0035DE080B